MTIKVNYLSEQQIERDTLGLLETYFHEQGGSKQIPIPVDEILETHLGLSLDFDDLQTVLGVPDVLGALWVDRREVFIDQSLEPEANPEMEGRFHFSVGHEIGHWRLHRQYLRVVDGQIATRSGNQAEPTVICRNSQARERIEVQADIYAAHLLMPTSAVVRRYEPDRYRSLERLEILDYVVPKLAEEFAVSRTAMRIRLENLGLLRIEHDVDQRRLGAF